MNPFAGLLGEPLPPLTAELPRHVHCMADEIDPDTGLASNAQGPKPPKHLVRAALAAAPRPKVEPLIVGGAPLHIPELGEEAPRVPGRVKIVYEQLRMSVVGPNGLTTTAVAVPRITHEAAWVWELPPVEEGGPVPAPRLLTPEPTPSPKAYRVPAPVPRAPMTYPEAMLIRDRARRRQPVTAAELLEANKVVQATRARSREQGE